MEDPRLKEYFRFDERDLEDNRNGRFSENQIALLKEADHKFRMGMRRHGIPFVLVALIGPVSAYFGGKALGLVWILVWGIVWTAIWGLIGWGLVQGSFDKPKLEFKKAKGPIKIAMKEGYNPKQKGSSVWNDLRVGRKHFEIQENLTSAIQSGDEYIVYYENDLEKIVALELISSTKTEAPDSRESNPVDFEARAKKLMKYFKFNETDLMANQSGTLSENQKSRIGKQAGGGRKGALAIGIILILVAAAGVVMAIRGWIGDSNTIFRLGFSLPFGIIWGLLWGGLGIFLVIVAISSTPQYKLLSMRGKANLVRGETSGLEHHHSTTYYDLHINGHEFDGDKEFIELFVQDAEYVIYYTQGAEEIVSVEFISSPS